VGTAKLPAAYSAGRYKRLDPQRRTSSCRSLSFSLSFFFIRSERSLILRLCFSCLSGLTLCVEEVRRRIFLENQLSLCPALMEPFCVPVSPCLLVHLQLTFARSPSSSSTIGRTPCCIVVSVQLSQRRRFAITFLARRLNSWTKTVLSSTSS